MISVIIPARNAGSTVAATIKSLSADRPLIGEVLLVDDGSDDGTAIAATRAAAAAALPLKVVAGSFGSAGAARNAGLDAARERHVFLLDADDEVFPGALALLLEALSHDPKAGLAVGSVLRRTETRPDKLKVPVGYGQDLEENARRYLRNEMWPIAMGSALFVAENVDDIRFPASISLDEDTCYWAAMLTRLPVATVSEPVLLYHLDEKRMEERFVSAPRTVLLRISMELNGLTRFGIGRDVLQWRKAWVALRIVRMLIMHRRYGEAGRIMRMARAHPDLRRGWKAFQYRARITGGRMAQTVGFCASMRRHSAKRLSLPLRTLILTYDPAYPAISGADLRNYQNALAASDLGPTMLVSIRAAARATAENDIAMAGLEIAGEPRGPSMVSRRTDAERRIPLAARSRLLRQVREFRPDAIIVEGIGLGALLEPLRPFARLLVLDMHNIESDLRARIREGKSFSERLLPSRFRQRKRIERQETDALRVVDRVWVCSDADRLRLERIATAAIPIDVVMNGIPRAGEIPAVLPALPGRSDGWPVLLFIAHLGYKPNIEACERLTRNIFPAIRKKFPKARLILAGRSPKPVVVQLAETAGVELVQDPGDLAPLFARGHLTVIPLTTGGGTRIKILEAMAWGLPVIATPVAAEGLGFTSGDGIILHESDEDLTAAAMALCSDAGRMDDLRRRAKAQVMLRYGPAAIADAVRRGMGL